jgi:predicted DNA-binding protein
MPGVSVSRILPPKEFGEAVTTSLRMPKGMMARLDAVAQESGYTRTEVILHFLKWALEEYEVEKASERKAKK